MRLRADWLNGLALALVAVVAVIALQAVATHNRNVIAVSDFRVVYCGELAAVRAHADPYLVEPLRSCEHRIGLETGEAAWAVTPYPLPSYATAAFAPLAYIPYKAARLAWIAILVLSVAIAAFAIAGVLETSPFLVGLVFAPTLGVLNLQYGEPVLVSVAALCLGALAVKRGHPTLAGVAVAVSMIEPHVGLPAAIGTFVFVSQARRTLLVAGAAFAVVGIVTLGVPANVEYARGFLPAQARAELFAADQYSLSRLLFVLGVDPDRAMMLGSLSYPVMLTVGLFAAWAFVMRGFSTATFVLVPVATAMLGGPFIHDVQIAAAVPAALVIAERRWVARVAVALLAVDLKLSPLSQIVSAGAAGFGVASIAFPRLVIARRGGYALAAIVLVLLVGRVFPNSHSTAVATQSPVPAIAANAISSEPWGWRIATTPGWSASGLGTVVPKLPVWFALALTPLSLLGLGSHVSWAALARRRRTADA